MISLLIIFFVLLIFYQVFFKQREGMLDLVPTIAPKFIPSFDPINKILPKLNFTQIYKNYDEQISPATFDLSQQNSNNISYLQESTQILIKDSYNMLDKKSKLKANINSLQDQITQFITQQTDYITKTIGTTPPIITGAFE